MTSRFRVLLSLLLAITASLGILFGQAQKKTGIPYPKGYRSWNHVKTMAILTNEHPLFSQFEGLHHVYVNDVGLTSLVQGRVYPEGTIFVFDLYNTRSARGAIEVHDRKLIAVMKKDSKLYKATGGWGFELFRGYEQQGSARDPNLCFKCHEPQKGTDYVFSTYMD